MARTCDCGCCCCAAGINSEVDAEVVSELLLLLSESESLLLESESIDMRQSDENPLCPKSFQIVGRRKKRTARFTARGEVEERRRDSALNQYGDAQDRRRKETKDGNERRRKKTKRRRATRNCREVRDGLTPYPQKRAQTRPEGKTQKWSPLLCV